MTLAAFKDLWLGVIRILLSHLGTITSGEAHREAPPPSMSQGYRLSYERWRDSSERDEMQSDP